MEKISVSDLSVGDYVRVKMCKWDYDDPDTLDAKVLSIEGNSVGVGYDNSGILMSAHVEDLQPIPITVEVLEKNGFYLKIDTCRIDTYGREGIYISMFSIPEITIIQQESYLIKNSQVQYIHQLQHALRLAKVEREIKL